MPPWSGDVVRGDGRALISRHARCARHDPSLFSNKWQYMHQKTLPVLAAQISFVFLFVHLLLAFRTLLLYRSVSDSGVGSWPVFMSAEELAAQGNGGVGAAWNSRRRSPAWLREVGERPGLRARTVGERGRERRHALRHQLGRRQRAGAKAKRAKARLCYGHADLSGLRGKTKPSEEAGYGDTVWCCWAE